MNMHRVILSVFVILGLAVFSTAKEPAADKKEPAAVANEDDGDGESIVFTIQNRKGKQYQVKDITFTSFNGRIWQRGRTWLSVNQGNNSVRISQSQLRSLKRVKRSARPWQLVFINQESEFVFVTAKSLKGKVVLAGGKESDFSMRMGDLQSMWRAPTKTVGDGKTADAGDDVDIGGDSADPTHDRIAMVGGDKLSGKVLSEEYTMETSYADMTFKSQEVARIVFDVDGKNRDAIHLANGDNITGTVTTKKIKLRLGNGSLVTLSVDKIKSIKYADR